MGKWVPSDAECAEAIDQAGELLNQLEPFVRAHGNNMEISQQELLIKAVGALTFLTQPGSDCVLWDWEA